jgi:protein-disulfide isomerase
MTQVSGRQVLAAASIVGLAVIAASLVLAQSLDRVTSQLDRAAGRLDEIRVAVQASKDALSKLQVAAAPAAAAPRRGPDPNRRYAVPTKGAPARGPETAAITIVEFSDFQ